MMGRSFARVASFRVLIALAIGVGVVVSPSAGQSQAPPKVFRPNSGFEPGIIAIDLIADLGIKSQLTTSPKGWLSLTPSIYTERPCGVPNNGDAVKPR